ncbi:dihydropteroate synthase [cyanobacterium endosymbiont of Rhopalodia gibberula]|uniref:dihydropteroate synthase n=1 Tax=cyanobacterium endosymbiont of Rhopalodia gibberula TaxID=1763363 RepID=UPI000E65082D|nr:dihydropteroate synthase [cyanobacterium endosymbiont of Rhopalodia gibberula]
MADLKLRQHSFYWGKRTYIMGILNITPDSFSDGGQFNTLETALIQARTLINSGADIIDIGGQSTRPGSQQILFGEELNRVIPLIKLLRQETSIPISIDTTRASVANAAIEAGADLVNDISGGTFDSQMFTVVAKLKVPIILMHIRGNPQTMQQLTGYTDLIGEVSQWLDNQLNLAIQAGIKRSHLIIDPGIGFAKTYSQNLELLRRLSEFRSLGQPILVGVSRKRFIGHILQENNPRQRLWGTAAACCGAISQSADILRVHDVAQIVDVALVADAIWRS